LTLAIFDLDHTLLDGDSDVLWGQFLGEQGLVDAREHERENLRYFDLYKSGNLDIYEFLRFQFSFLATHDLESLHRWRHRFIDEKVRPVVLPRALDLLREHRGRGHTLLIVTATNRFITEPIAALLGVDNLIATEPEMRDGRYTGGVCGVPSFAAGKVTRVRQWIGERGLDLTDSWFYSDSHNDLPLLREVRQPVAVDPDDLLRAEALKNDWPVISLR
jgi:HAD superfamily hydrolase (TIGR01490 family)